jgi:hypothetical protein
LKANGVIKLPAGRDDMSIQQLFSLFMALVSLLGIAGSASLQMTVRHNIGPGTMPMMYSITLLTLSIFLFFSDMQKREKIDWSRISKCPLVGGWIFYLLCFIMCGLSYLFGFVPPMIAFSISSLLLLKRQKFLKALIFSTVWVAALYVIFVVLLHVPFPHATYFR